MNSPPGENSMEEFNRLMDRIREEAKNAKPLEFSKLDVVIKPDYSKNELRVLTEALNDFINSKQSKKDISVAKRLVAKIFKP